MSLLAAAPTGVVADCISLANSTQCSAFSAASISTSQTLIGLFPFLKFVSNTADFDSQLASYVKTSYIELKFQTLLGCTKIQLTNTAELYAQYTTSVICNSIIQNSKNVCGLSTTESAPLCADSCALHAESEEAIVVNSAICGGVNSSDSGVQTQIRADFTNCALPTDSLTGSCIQGSTNEPDNCGFGNSTFGLCEFCSGTGTNSTDTCCYNSDIKSRCAGVVLPSISATMTFPTAASSASSSPTAGASASHRGLSAGAKAGIAVGAVVGFLLLLLLLILLIFCCRKRRAQSSHGSSVFNQPTPARRGTVTNTNMAYNPVTSALEEFEAPLPGGRIARMSALEEPSGNPPSRSNRAEAGSAVVAEGVHAADHSRLEGRSSSSGLDSPISARRAPLAQRRHGSLSSTSALGSNHEHSSPSSGREVPATQGGAETSQQSEQLAYFKDYYSQDEIHPGSKVSTLWAYQPRATDEFALERGDMLKIVGIWDDGWATGVMLREKADEWEERRKAQRDSGIAAQEARREESPPATGEIKAFPLVCVCLPEHWRKTIDGDGSTESGSQAPM